MFVLIVLIIKLFIELSLSIVSWRVCLGGDIVANTVSSAPIGGVS